MVLLSINRNDLYAKGKTIAGPVAVFRHMDYLIRYLGEDRVGFGTDLQADGKYIPMDLQQEDCFQKIGGFMKEKGYSPQRIRKLMGRNYLDFLNEVAQLQKQLN